LILKQERQLKEQQAEIALQTKLLERALTVPPPPQKAYLDY
jgi:hypothetical protein